jgi:hypothetical protein
MLGGVGLDGASSRLNTREAQQSACLIVLPTALLRKKAAMTYREKSTQLALDSAIAVLVLGNEDCTDIEMLPLKPRQMPEGEKEYLQRQQNG